MVFRTAVAVIVFLSISVLNVEAMGVRKKEETAHKGSINNADEILGKTTGNLARAVIKGTSDESKLYGELKLIESEKGVFAFVELSNVEGEGKHGFHVHEKGSCDDGGKAAGGHFNPHKVDHGHLVKDGPQKAHIGDMGNVLIDADGEGQYDIFLPGVTLSSGKNNIIGHAVIVHALEDDFGQPTGNAGGRIGCGVIVKTDE